MTGFRTISAAVEGIIDEAAIKRLIVLAGGVPGPMTVKNGKTSLLSHLRGYANAAQFSPWVVLVDLDTEADCAPAFLRSLGFPLSNSPLCFRVAVREVESWFLADQERMASWLGVRLDQVPRNPDDLPDPKSTLVRLASLSPHRHIREDMVPRPDSGRSVGPGYTSRVIEFIRSHSRGWRPEVAKNNSESLNRCTTGLVRLIKGGQGFAKH